MHRALANPSRPSALCLAKLSSSRLRAVRVFASSATTQVQEKCMARLSEDAKQRARAAVLGAMVADCASMPLHWIYDVPKMEALLAAEGRSPAAPEFFPTPSCPFYQAKFGEQSPYGSELVPLMRTLAAEGDLDPVKFSQALHEFFTTGTAYRNASIRKVIENYEAGKRGAECGHDKDSQANCFAKAAVLVAKFGGTPDLLKKAEQAIRVQQNNDDAVKYGLAGVRLLEKVVVDGWSAERALQWASGEGSVEFGPDVKALVDRALGTKQQPLRELQFEVPEYMQEMVGKHVALKDSLPPFTYSVWCNGPACGNPAAFTNVAMTAANFPGYVEGVRANLMAGGDNCSRVLLIGALLAAQQGVDAIPEEWRKQTQGYSEYEQLVDKLLA